MLFSRGPQLKRISFLLKKHYETMKPEQYLFNQRDANISREIITSSLFPLPQSNHSEGSTDEIALYGIPKGKVKELPGRDILTSAMEANHPDLIFLQFTPENWIVRQRFMAHKAALKGVEDYVVNGLEKMDPIVPDSWEECVVNLVIFENKITRQSVLDSLRENKVHTELFLPDGFFCYSYPHHQDAEKTKELTQPFIDSISKHIVTDHFSEYNIINQILYTSLMGKQKVLLAEMPEPLLRWKIGNALTVGEVRDLFKFVLEKIGELRQPIPMKEATLNFLPHVFQAPKDLYLTAMLKEAFQAATCIAAFVGLPHYNPIKDYWKPAPDGINWSEAVRIPERVKGETDAEQIEKQAILDVMLDSRAWGKKYISNPFPYLVDDITKVKEDELLKMKKTFLLNFKKYESFKNKSVPGIEGGEKPNLFIPEGQTTATTPKKKKIFV